MIYLASPYSHERESVMERRYRQVLAATAMFTREGHMIYSPIVHFHEAARIHDMPKDFEFWSAINLHMLELADTLWVLKLPGWRESVGVSAEIAFAEARNIPYKEINPKQWS